MIVMAVLAALAGAVILPALSRPTNCSNRIRCVNNLKQVGLATRQWAMDHGDRYPMHTPVAEGGTMDHDRFAEAWVHFVVMSNELNTPKVLICPEDPLRNEQWTFATNLSNQDVSYFMGDGAKEEEPATILAGDRNLTTNGVAVYPGLYTLDTREVVGWSKSLHELSGNLAFADGSVRQLTSAALQQYLAANPHTNRLAIP